ncbi:MAG TPA: DUF1847 domain-containing protein [Thermodesulfobacteriota bacterium]|nr:DUF1847 domain-containing protein [Thermodesulfobacteriota bacterium]
MKDETEPRCVLCGVEKRICQSQKGSGPPFCPTRNKEEEIKAALKKYEDPETMRFAREASRQEAECYAGRDREPFVLRPTKTRVEEIIEFSRKMGYRKLGVAFCAGLMSEGKTFVSILDKHGFEVVSVCCKAGGVPKEFLGLEAQEKIRIGKFDTMCNPIAQADLLNRAGTEFNVLVGLCVGHDSLFFKHAEAPSTVLVVKDRVLGHNPVAALYGAKVYFQRLTHPDEEGKS